MLTILDELNSDLKEFVEEGGSGGELSITPYSVSGEFNHYGYLEVEHPELEEGAEYFYSCHALHDAKLSQTQNLTAYGDTHWDREDIKGSITTYTRDGENTGHFDVAIGAKVKVGCGVTIDGTEYYISAITGDGTSANDITLTIDAATGTVSKISGIKFGWNFSLSEAGGVYPSNVWYYAITKSPNLVANKLFASINYIATNFSIYSGAAAKVAVSVDGGTTWLDFDNTSQAWTSMSLSDFATRGCVGQSGYGQPLLDNTGAFISVEGWASLDLSSYNPEDILFAIAVMTTDIYAGISNDSFAINYNQAAYVQPLTIGSADVSPQVIIREVDSTHSLFYNASMSYDYAEAICIVWIKS